jgi:hypothetical protein
VSGWGIVLLVLTIIAGSALISAAWQLTHDMRTARRRNAPAPQRGDWLQHPCTLPSDMGMTAEGLIWACHCGRQWKYLHSEPGASYPYSITRTWTEWTAEKQLAESKKQLEKVKEQM